MASLLIIGGSGFFGKSFLDSYKRGLLNDFEINRIDIISRSASTLSFKNPELMQSSIGLHDVDITTCTSIPKADIVIHAAASTDAKNYIQSPLTEKINIQAATINYCELAKRFHQNSKIVYVSSGAVYASQPNCFDVTSEGCILGDVKSLPLHKRDYALAKRDAESEIKKISEVGLNVSIARCFAFVGKYLPRDKHFAAGNFIGDALLGAKIVVNADKKVYRSYQHADDLVHWLLKIALHSSPRMEIYNVGSSDAIELCNLAEMIAQAYGLEVAKRSHIDSNLIDFYVPNVDKAKNELNLTNNYSSIEAVMNTIEMLKS